MTTPVDVAETSNPDITSKAFGSVVRVSVTDPNIAEVIEAGYDRLMIERSLDAGLSYSEVSRPSERPALSALQTSYSFQDRAGSASYLYRTRYRSSRDGSTTDPSEAVEGAGLMIRNLLSVADLKARYFFGINTRNPETGEEMPDSTYQHYILSAIRLFEMDLSISLLPTTYTEKHDYVYEDFIQHMVLQLDNYPVIQLDALKATFGASEIMYPPEWYRLDADVGHLQVQPSTSAVSSLLLSTGGAYMPSLYNSSRIPQLFQVDYTAGFAEGKLPRNIVDVIGMVASLGPFNIFGELIAGAGIANFSISMDGLSQSVGTTQSAMYSGFGARISNYLAEIKRQMPILRKQFKRVGGLVVA